MDSGPAPRGASGMTKSLRHAFSFPRHDLPESCIISPPSSRRGRRECRMLAAPARPACKEMHFAHASNHRAAEQPALPAQWCYGLYVVSSVRRAFWPPSPCVRHARLDPSVGGSGPHDFAVRFNPFVFAIPRPGRNVHRSPPPTLVTIAKRPSGGSGMRREDHIFPKNGS